MLSAGAIHSAVARARWGPFPKTGTVHERAALLMRGIAQDHPFLDGNKRTSFEAADTFLTRNGYHVDAGSESVVRFTVALARGDHDLKDAVAWFEKHTANS